MTNPSVRLDFGPHFGPHLPEMTYTRPHILLCCDLSRRKWSADQTSCSTRKKKNKKNRRGKKTRRSAELHRFLNRFQFIPVFGNSGKGDGVTISGKYQYFSCSDSILCQIARLAPATLHPVSTAGSLWDCLLVFSASSLWFFLSFSFFSLLVILF